MNSELDLRLYYAYSASGPKGRSEGHGTTAVVPSAYFYKVKANRHLTK
jgi:hypothetical protein